MRPIPTANLDPVDMRYPNLLPKLRLDGMKADILDICEEQYRSFSVFNKQATNVQKATGNQNICCPLWCQRRMRRKTASKANDILVQNHSTSPDNLVRRIA